MYLWFIRMFQNTQAIPQSCFFKEVFWLYGAKLWEHQCQSMISIKLLCNFVKTTLSHCWSPVNLQYIYRIPLSKNTSGWCLARILLAQATKYQLCNNPADLRKMLLLLSRELKIQSFQNNSFQSVHFNKNLQKGE